MKRYSILGISLRDYTAREALKLIDRFLGGGVMNTVACITAQRLAETAKQDDVKELVENTDLTICIEPDILEAAGIASAGRIREIEEHVVLREVLEKAGTGSVSVFLLGDTQEDALVLKRTLDQIGSGVRIAGCAGYDTYEYQPERVMNALNEAAPQIIFSKMAWPKDLELMHLGRKFLNAQLWIAMPEKEIPGEAKVSLLKKVQKLIFQKQVTEYNNGKAD